MSETQNEISRYDESHIVTATIFFREAVFDNAYGVTFKNDLGEVIVTPDGWTNYGNPISSPELPLFSSIPAIVVRRLTDPRFHIQAYERNKRYYHFFQGAHPPYYLDTSGSNVFPKYRESVLRDNPVMRLVLQDHIRRMEVEEFVVHQKSIVDNLSITTEQKELYTLLLLQWCIAAQDNYNVADGTNWTILQKCMAYSIKDFVKDKNQTQIWNNITKADLVPPILAGQDWLGKYPINPDSTYNLVGTTGNSFLRNAGDLYDINSNYAKALRVLEYGEVKKLSERY